MVYLEEADLISLSSVFLKEQGQVARSGHEGDWKQQKATGLLPKRFEIFWGKGYELPDGPIPILNLTLSTASKFLALNPVAPCRLQNRLLTVEK